MSKLTTTLLTGYRDYAKEHPEADYSGLGENFIGYLNTEKAELRRNNIKDIIEASGSVEVSIEELRQLIKDIMTGFQKYAQEKGYTDMTKLDEYLTEYLQTEECQQILTAWAEKNIHINGDVNITKEQLEKLSKELLEGYEAYVQENGYADPAKMGEYFMDYLGTDQRKQTFPRSYEDDRHEGCGRTDIHGNRNLYAECIFFLWKYSVTGTGNTDFKSDGADDDTDRRWYGKAMAYER